MSFRRAPGGPKSGPRATRSAPGGHQKGPKRGPGRPPPRGLQGALWDAFGIHFASFWAPGPHSGARTIEDTVRNHCSKGLVSVWSRFGATYAAKPSETMIFDAKPHMLRAQNGFQDLIVRSGRLRDPRRVHGFAPRRGQTSTSWWLLGRSGRLLACPWRL